MKLREAKTVNGPSVTEINGCLIAKTHNPSMPNSPSSRDPEALSRISPNDRLCTSVIVSKVLGKLNADNEIVSARYFVSNGFETFAPDVK